MDIAFIIIIASYFDTLPGPWDSTLTLKCKTDICLPSTEKYPAGWDCAVLNIRESRNEQDEHLNKISIQKFDCNDCQRYSILRWHRLSMFWFSYKLASQQSFKWARKTNLALKNSALKLVYDYIKYDFRT